MDRPVTGDRGDSPRPLEARAALVAGVAGFAGYLAWRLTIVSGAHPLAAGLLLGVEIAALVPLLAGAVAVWSAPGRILSPGMPDRDAGAGPAPELDVTVVVTTHRDPVELVHETLLGAALLRPSGGIVLCDDGGSTELRGLARRLGVAYRSRPRATATGGRAGNLNHHLADLETDWVLVLAAAEVPLADALQIAGPALGGDVGVALLGRVARDLDDALVESRPPAPVAKAMADAGSLQWHPGPCLVRLAALRAAGMFDEGIVRPEYAAGVRVQAAGWAIAWGGDELVVARAPHNAETRAAARRRDLRSMYAVWSRSYGPLRAEGLSLRQRAAIIGDLRPALDATRRSVLALVAAWVLVADVVPLRTGVGGLVVIAGAYGLRAWARRFIEGRRGAFTERLRRDLEYFGTDLGSALTLGSAGRTGRADYMERIGVESGGMQALRTGAPLLAVVVGLDLAVLLAATGTLFDLGVGAKGLLLATTAAGALVMSSAATGVLSRMVLSRQRREQLRLGVDMPIYVDGHEARVFDLSPGGLGVITRRRHPVGTTVALVVDLPHDDRAVSVPAEVRHRTAIGESGAWFLGLGLSETSQELNDTLLTYCAAVWPLVSLRGTPPALEAVPSG